MPVKCTKSESSYMAGCRCDDCRSAHTKRERERRTEKRQGTAQKSPSARARSGGRGLNWDDALTRGQIAEARGWEK